MILSPLAANRLQKTDEPTNFIYAIPSYAYNCDRNGNFGRPPFGQQTMEVPTDTDITELCTINRIETNV